MQIHLDTGILLRLLHQQATNHAEVRDAVRLVKSRGMITCTSLQNIAEFWNVCTRPATARGGLGLADDETLRRLQALESIVTVLPDPIDLYPRWRSLVTTQVVRGVQVHDARIVAFMMGHSINDLLTLNASDFLRYTQIKVATPANVLVT
jgi:predicted nucleic acid-binding protein